MKLKKSKTKGQSTSISEVIAQSCGLNSVAYDPKLSDIFSSSNIYQVKPEDVPPPSTDSGDADLQQNTKLKNKKSKDSITLSHNDAASIRVKAKKKSQDSSKGKSANKKPKLKRQTTDFEVEEMEAEPANEPEDTEDSEVREVEVVSEENKVQKEDKVLSIAELNAPKAKKPELEERTVFVGNVPKDFTTKQLKKLFKDHGEIESIRFRGAAPSKPTQLKKVALYRNEIHPDRNSLVAFIRYKTREEAEQSVQAMNGIKVNEHHLTVDLADNKTKDDKKAIFIGNLYLKINDDDLWNYFEDCGKIHSVRIVRDPITGLGKGIGFVNFEDQSGVEIALKKNGSELKGRAMRISRAAVNKKKKKSEFSETVQRNKSSKVQEPTKRSKDWKAHGKPEHTPNKINFAGDQIAEIGKLKRKSSKPNRGEAKKARIAKQLAGNSTTKSKRSKPKKQRIGK